MVTVETAVAIPMLLVVGLAAAGVPAAVGAQIRCADAARDAALLVARGVPADEAAALVTARAPQGARVAVTTSVSAVDVTVSAQVSPVPGPLQALVSVPVSAQSSAPREPEAPW